MKKILYLVSGLIVIFALSGCTGSSGTKINQNPEKIESKENKTQETQLFKMEESIKLGDYIITVFGIEEYQATNQFLMPKEGNKLVAIEVSYENNTPDKTISYNPLDWKLFDQDGYNFESGFTESKEPKLSSGTINPGGKVKGWITFEVPQSSEQFKAQFQPSFLSNENIEIQLYE